MKRFALVTSVAATLVFACAAAQAQTPKLVCKNYTDAWATPAAVVATTGTVSNAAADYLVAASADVNGYLEVKAFQNNCSEVGHFHTDIPVPIGAPITSVAAADLNSSQIVTAVVDQNGTLQLRTWTVGGTKGIAPLNAGYFSSTQPAAPGTTLGITALSSTTVVTAYQDPSGNFQLQQFNIPSGGVPATVGEPLNLGSALTGKGLCTAAAGAPIQAAFGSPSTIAIATVDTSLSMFATAASDSQGNMYVDVWFQGSNGTFVTAGQSCVPSIQNHLYPSLAIAGGYGQVEETTGKLHFFANQHYAVTPVANGNGGFNVLYWDVSDTGALSRTGDKTAAGPPDFSEVTGTAAAMLPTGIPMSAFLQGIDINVGWYGYTGEHVTSEVNTAVSGPGVFGVSAANAGASFVTSLLEVESGTAYFVTGTMVAYGNLPPMVAGSSPANEGVFQLNLWSYPVVEFR